MRSRASSLQNPINPLHQVGHILVAGIGSSDKVKLIRHISDIPLESVDLTRQLIPTQLPPLIMGRLQVDSRLTVQLWGAPEAWQHDYVNYLVNIATILSNQGQQHRVMGMMVVVNSCSTLNSTEEGKLVRLVEDYWRYPYIILASHPYLRQSRTHAMLRKEYEIDERIPIHSCDVSDVEDCKRAIINLMYHIL